MTVLQNIRCGVRSGSRAEKRRRAEEKLRRFRLEGLEKKYPAQLSGGQQRTALLRAGKHGPRRENDRSVQHPRGQMPVLQVKVK